jgi:chaperonin GroEL (HSP60 family)
MGFDIVTQEYFKDMTEKGIIDSYNTIKCSLEDAISVATLIINTECIVYKEIEYERKFNIHNNSLIINFF